MGRKFQVWETERFAQIQAERLARARAVRDGQRSHGSGE
jgi:DNA-binding transcriptional regulator/RsmH inhibitor MraZ